MPTSAAHGSAVSASAGSRRISWLDGLRGIAAMAVVLGHFFWGMLNFPGQWLFDPGVFGVSLFFLISGYIVPATVRVASERPALNFVWSRFFRLYPLYWLSLVGGGLVFGSSLTEMLGNVTMVQRFIGMKDVINVYWTLQVEIVFYGIVFLLIVIRRCDRYQVAVGLSLLFSILTILFGFVRFYLHVKSPIAIPMGLTVIFVGTLKSLVDRDLIPISVYKRTIGSIVCCLLLSFYLGYSHDWGYGDRPERFVVSYFVSAAIFFGAAHFGYRRFSILATLGVVSYPIYLVHQPIIACAVLLFPHVNTIAVHFVALVLVVALGFILHFAIEKPGIRLGRFLLTKHLHRSTVVGNVVGNLPV
jgi:peptidoglycan/LPS O-acetylase OafA/YrhL